MARSHNSFHLTAPLLTTALLLVTLALGGCDSGTQEPAAPEPEAIEFGAPPPAETAPEASADQPADGSIANDRFPSELPEGASAAIPNNFPPNVPVYPGATPAMGMGGKISGSERAGVQLLSNDAPSDVLAYYRGELAATGWEISEGEGGSMGSSLTATNGNAQIAVFVQASADGGSDVFVISQQ